MISAFALFSILLTIAALFSFLSYRVLRLPSTIGTMILTLCAAGTLLLVGYERPEMFRLAEHFVSAIDFNQVVLHGMLAFLLFAGALQLDLSLLLEEKLAVIALSVAGTALSTILVAVLLHWGLLGLGYGLSWAGALLFGALISPTDPIAVLDMLRRAGAPPRLEMQLAGESLFNDGVGAVIFLALLGSSGGEETPSLVRFGVLLLLKAGGGIGLGAVLGYVASRMIRMVDSYRVEVLLTLALAAGGYSLADRLRLSAPLEVVTAGLLLGGRVRKLAMSVETREHLDRFWELIDEFMNVVLFLLLGLQLLVLPFGWGYLVAGLVAIPVVLASRFASVALVMGAVAYFRRQAPGSILVLTWGGLRGGLAVALALSLPRTQPGERSLLLAVTFIVVVFSILVQGLSLAPLLRSVQRRESVRKMVTN